MPDCRVCRCPTKSATGYHARCWSGLPRGERAAARAHELAAAAWRAEEDVAKALGLTGLTETPKNLASRLSIKRNVAQLALENLVAKGFAARVAKRYFPSRWASNERKDRVAS